MGFPASNRLRAAIASAAALAALAASAAPASAAPESVPAASAAEVDRIGGAALAALSARQHADGRFDDRTGKLIGGGGLPSLAWVGLRQARHSADGREWRIELARRLLRQGSGASVIQRWPLAMTVAGDLDDLLEDERQILRDRVTGWGPLKAAGVADRCYQRPRCFNNYKLADAILNLELARTGLQSTLPRTRLYAPATTSQSTIAWLASSLPAAAPATAEVLVPGSRRAQAAILSDPETRPLAYHALCTAWIVRATALLGPSAPQELRVLTRRALWGLLGVAAPNGEVSWSGRGQDQVWSLSSALYAAAAGSRLFAATDPVLAGRLRRLADIELGAIGRRLDERGELQILPAGNHALAGLDHYYTEIGSAGLGLLWLELARDELPDAGAVRMPLPSEVDRSVFADAETTGLVTRRWGRSWMGLRMRRDHQFDPRQDFGLMRALRQEGGVWREQRPVRPRSIFHTGRVPQAVPAAGPTLLRKGARYTPTASRWRAIRGGVELIGDWRSKGGVRRPGRWRFTASAQGASMAVRCRRRNTFELAEWLPGAGAAAITRTSVGRDGYRLTLSRPAGVSRVLTRFASSRHDRLDGYRVRVRCSSGWLQARWSGAGVAGG